MKAKSNSEKCKLLNHIPDRGTFSNNLTLFFIAKATYTNKQYKPNFKNCSVSYNDSNKTIGANVFKDPFKWHLASHNPFRLSMPSQRSSTKCI